MSQSQVYLFLYEQFDVWKWITGKTQKMTSFRNRFESVSLVLFCRTKTKLSCWRQLIWERTLLHQRRNIDVDSCIYCEIQFFNLNKLLLQCQRQANNFKGAPLKRTFTLAVTNISEKDFTNKITCLKQEIFTPSRYHEDDNNSSHFAVALIMYLLEMNHVEPEILEYLHPSYSR